MEFLTFDPRIKAIVAYIEGVEGGYRFINAIRNNELVVTLKAGKSECKVKVAASHAKYLTDFCKSSYKIQK